MRDKFYLLKLFILLFFLGWVNKLQAQTYGLGFSGHEVVLDQRTGLDLSPGKNLYFDKDFELSFQMGFLITDMNNFGYILRIIDGNGRNIDFIYDINPNTNKFKVIDGSKYTNIGFNLKPDRAFHDWSDIIIKFSYTRQNITFIAGKRSFVYPLKLTTKTGYKFLFGTNDYQGFKTKDIPSIKLRNIKILENNKLKYYWPLADDHGDIATEQVNRNNGQITNPKWVKGMHSKWALIKTIITKGAASVAFDDNKEDVHVIGADSLHTYSIASCFYTNVKYTSGTHTLLRGNQALYDPLQKKLLNYYVDQKTILNYNLFENSWNKNFRPDSITDYWHTNKFYSTIDSSVYILNGYGHFRYRKDIQRYHLPTDTWSNMEVKGRFLTPRYLAAVGSAKNGAYILGGYGSESGQQTLNPNNLYDLLFFDVRTRTIKKIYELKTPHEDFVFANSMVINEKEQAFYALIFPKHKYNSQLQLIKGSLTRPGIQLAGDTIPYTFHDINSFSDLFYAPFSKRFVAVTMFRTDEDQTIVKIYVLNSPPLPITRSVVKAASHNLLLIVSIMLLIGAIGSFIYVKNNKGRAKNRKKSVAEPVAPMPAALLEKEIDAITNMEPETLDEPQQKKSAIFLFGDMQLYDDNGAELTKHFTRLTQELFLVILLYTMKSGRGISSEKLKELLWFDKTAESAKNNRSVNIVKLRGILETMQYCQVTKEAGPWRIEIDHEYMYVDYHQYLTIVGDKKKLTKEKIIKLGHITQRGNFLTNTDYAWLDSFKYEITYEIIDTYLHYANSVKIADDPEFLIQLTRHIFYFDAVNEEAMSIRCKALSFLGKHSLAKSTYENFCKEYKSIYGETFGKDFHTMLE
ncbi:MAG: galactose oxidase [Sphingobacteriaceae bacterium]|nr:MAG: galactose oxidase [Sphingobacteriaceae bacterium]